MSDLLYRLEQVLMRHSDSFALNVERLEIQRGETFCLLGPTGAGKSTLLRLLSLLLAPDKGRIWFLNESRCSWPLATLRRIVTVAQRPALLNHSVRHNVEFGLRARGVADARTRAGRVLELLQLDSIAEQNAQSLSGGQTQLVSLARALAIEPEVLLLDEPTANLDPAHVALVEEAIEEQHLRTGSTVVWVTHNLFQARRRANTTALLWGGHLIEVNNTATFFEQPNHATTSLFVQGKMVY